MSKLLELALERRGYTKEFLDDINDGSYDKLLDIDVLANRLYELKNEGKKIVVLPDFDMDGIMSGVVGYVGLSELGFNVELFIPDPSKGYGFRAETIDLLVERHPEVNVILTCDNGISCFEGITHAKKLGLEVIVTDHHKQPIGKKVDADIIVNPMRVDEVYKHPAICGAFTLYQCLYNYAEQYTEGVYYLEQIERLKLFAGMGTVSDMMPVLYENRILIQESISFLRQISTNESWVMSGSNVYKQCFNNVRNLVLYLKEQGKVLNVSELNEDFYGFQLAPMFNSIKRLDGDMNKAFSALLGTKSESLNSIKYLLEMNERRKQMVADYFPELESMDEDGFIYLSEASSGVLGLLAMKKMEETGKPVVVVRYDGASYHGSGRSPEWYKFNSRVSAEGFHIGGHEGAFGIGFTDIHELRSCGAFLGKDVPEVYDNLEFDESDVRIADVVVGEDIDVDVVELNLYRKACESLRPFGTGLPLLTTGIIFEYDPSKVFYMGTEKQHVKFTCDKDLTVICWNSAHIVKELSADSTIRVVGSLSMNEFNDIKTLTLIGGLV